MRQAKTGFHRVVGAEKRRARLGQIRYDEVAAHRIDAGGYRPDREVMDGRHAGNGQQLLLQQTQIDFGRKRPANPFLLT